MKIKAIFLVLLSIFSVTVSSGQKANKKFLVTGKVTNLEQKAIAGALIMVDGKNTNIVTNDNGVYRIKVRPDADSLTVVTFNNGISTVAIKGQTSINFTLGMSGTSQQKFQDMSGKNEQVNIGYGTVSEKNRLTQVNTVNGTNSKYATYKNIYEILRGLPGIMVRGTSIKIQGQSSFTGGTEPLFVVDGMTVETIDNIPPAMVESISILKGASTSIYGARGANGVILITLIRAPQIK